MVDTDESLETRLYPGEWEPANKDGMLKLLDYEREDPLYYIEYTKKQENVTPEFQKLMAALREKYGSVDNIPQEVRDEIHRESLPLMKWNGLLTFNFRESWLFLFCLLVCVQLHSLTQIIDELDTYSLEMKRVVTLPLLNSLLAQKLELKND